MNHTECAGVCVCKSSLRNSEAKFLGLLSIRTCSRDNGEGYRVGPSLSSNSHGTKLINPPKFN